MSFLKTLYHSLTLRCFGALALGIAAVSFIAVEIAMIGFDDAPTEVAVVEDSTPFPEDEITLREMAVRMLQEHDLPALETAAGDTDTVDTATE